MGHIESDVTIKHKIVKVYSYSAKKDFSRKDDKPVIIGNKSLVEDLSVNYLLFGGRIENDYLPVYLKFRAYWNGRIAERAIDVLLFGVDDKILGVKSNSVLSVFVPDYVTSNMYGNQNRAILESYPPKIS